MGGSGRRTKALSLIRVEGLGETPVPEKTWDTTLVDK